MQIFVKLWCGRNIVIDVEIENLIQEIKYKIQDVEGVPIESQILQYEGIQLQNDKTLSDYKIEPESSIKLLLPLHGGMQKECNEENNRKENEIGKDKSVEPAQRTDKKSTTEQNRFHGNRNESQKLKFSIVTLKKKVMRIVKLK